MTSPLRLCPCRVPPKVLLLADLRGIDSHGIARLHAYFEMLVGKVINPR